MEKKVLVAEVEEDERKLLSDLLKDLGYETIQTNDLQNVSSLSLSSKPDLIILSDKEQGNRLTDTIKALKEGDSNLIPLLVVLSEEESSQRDALRKIGIEDFIFRPYSIVSFLNKIKEMLSE